MRKVILFSVMLLGLAFSAQAQKFSKNAIGLRFGDSNGFGGEVSYQRGLSKSNRLEADLGWRNNRDFDALQLTAVYQWVWNIDGGFNWYAGVGGGLGHWSNSYYKNNAFYAGDRDKGTYAFAAGDIGIEYNFDIPLMVSLDFRPEFGSTNYYRDSYNSDIAVSLRYRFN